MQETALRRICLRVHVGFAVLAAQKVYFDLQMAAFYMQITEKKINVEPHKVAFS